MPPFRNQFTAANAAVVQAIKEHPASRGFHLSVVLAVIGLFNQGGFKEYKLPHGITGNKQQFSRGFIHQFKGDVTRKTGVNESGVLHRQTNSTNGRTPLNKAARLGGMVIFSIVVANTNSPGLMV